MLSGSYTVPAGCIVFIPLMEIHRNKKTWGDDADEFVPERFASEHVKNLHPYAYLPFARGPRNCIGNSYAMKSMKVVLSYFFRNYKVSTNLKLHDLTFEFTVTSKVIQGYIVKMTKREFAA